MKVQSPKQVTWYVALVLAVLALLGQFAVAALAPYAFWLAVVSAVLLLVATVVDGL